MSWFKWRIMFYSHGIMIMIGVLHHTDDGDDTLIKIIICARNRYPSEQVLFT